MVSPTINRLRGPTRVRARNAKRREQRLNAQVAGKKLHRETTLKVSTDGKHVVKAASSKKIKKKAQRARLLSVKSKAGGAAMEDA